MVWALVTAFRSFENSPSPFAPSSLPEVTPTTPISERVIVMISDGLRADLAGELPNISSLAKRSDASFHVAQTAMPSLSEPGWTAILSGAEPRISGVRTNAYSGSPVPVETLFQTAARAGVPTAVAGAANEWEELFRGQPDEVHVAPFPYGKGSSGDSESDPLVMRVLESPARLMVLYYPAVDDSSHYHGPFSDEGVAAMLGFDRRVGEIMRRLDLARDTLVVTSDHGHIDSGGHGGYEDEARGATLLMVGKGVRKSGPLVVSQLDIAPTIAVLLGIGRPRDAEGMPLLDSVEAETGLKYEAYSIHEKALSRRLSADYAVISGVGAPDGTPQVLRERIESASWRRGMTEVARRLPVGIGFVIVLALIARSVGAFSARTSGAAVICLVLVAVGIWSTNFSYSLSYFNTAGDEERLLLTTIGSTLVGMAVAGLLMGSKTTEGAWHQALRVSSTVLLVCGIFVSALMIYYGPTTGWRLPDLRLSWALFIIPSIVGIAAVAGLPLAAATAKASQRATMRTRDAESESEMDEDGRGRSS